MEIHIGKIIGRIGEKVWTQVHEFENVDPAKLVVVLSLQIEEIGNQIDMTLKGREMLNRIQELFFLENKEKPILDNLKSVSQKMSEDFIGLEIIFLAIKDNVLYLISTGGGVWTKIGNREGFWIKGEGVGSGWLREGQLIVGGNNRFWQEVPLGVVRAAVENSEMENIVEALAGAVHGSEERQGGAGIVIKVFSRPEVKKEEAKKKIVWPSIKLPEWGFFKQTYVVREDKTLARKKLLWTGIFFLIILLGLVLGWQVKKTGLEKKTSAFNQTLEEVQYKFNEAKAVLSLNPSRSRELLKEIKPTVESWQAGKKNTQTAQILGDWTTVWDQAAGVKNVQPETVLDLGLVRENMKGVFLKKTSEGLLVADTDNSRLVAIDPIKKSGEVTTGKDDLGQIKLVATYPGKTIVLSDKGIVECQTKCQLVVPYDESWGEVVDIKMWSGNIYILSKSGIWRHQVVDNGYGGKQDWLAKSENAGILSSSSSMAIDGSVWVVVGDRILKFTRGVSEDFEVGDLGKKFGSKAVVYTDENLDKLYILDSENARIVVIKKTGEYDSQYLSNDFKQATDLVVDKEIYLLAGNKIWKVGL